MEECLLLFKTVYGPELECVYKYLLATGPLRKSALHRVFAAGPRAAPVSTANLDDALRFLVSGGLVTRDGGGRYRAVGMKSGFNTALLRRLRLLQSGALRGGHALDGWYLELADRIFIKPDRILVYRLHQEANALEAPAAISAEKINAWKRVLEFLGVGARVGSGFMLMYRSELLLEILALWAEEEGPLETFLEDHVAHYLPWRTAAGGIAGSLRKPLRILSRGGYIKLSGRQDLPHRGFSELGRPEVKWIKRGVSTNVALHPEGFAAHLGLDR